MAVTYLRNPTTGEFEKVGPGGASTDTTLSQAGKPADAAAVTEAIYTATAPLVSMSQLSNIFSTYYDLDTTVTPGENYSSASGSATLVGNILRIRLSANRTSIANGNIDNETVATFSVSHGGKITGGFAVGLNNGTSGHIANMLIAGVSCDETALTFRITLTATGGDTNAVNPFFMMPVLIDVSKF